jgi:enterochelin esterase family protein
MAHKQNSTILAMRRMLSCMSFAAMIFCTLTASGQTAPAKPPPKPSEVISGNRILWRLRAPAEAKSVQVLVFELKGPVTQDLKLGTNDLWTATSEPLDPDLYEYHFIVDHMNVLDPANPLIKDRTNSMLLVRGTPANPWDEQDVPHGVVHIHYYQSHSLRIERRLHVYTPPGYETGTIEKYPVLYLLHGSGDDDAGWTTVGRANVIFDNLIQQGKAKPFVCVMPFGHTPNAPSGKAEPGHVGEPFERDLLEDVIPLVESHYRVYTDQPHRALSGLSMGGSQTLRTGLTHLDRFAWLCPMSAGHAPVDEILAAAPQLKSDPKFANEHLKMFWMGCGDADKLLEGNQETDKWLTSLGIHHEFHVTPGVHTWPIWRRYLVDVTPRLFQD